MVVVRARYRGKGVDTMMHIPKYECRDFDLSVSADRRRERIDGTARLAYGRRALFACKPVCAWRATAVAAATTTSLGFPIPRDRKSAE